MTAQPPQSPRPPGAADRRTRNAVVAIQRRLRGSWVQDIGACLAKLDFVDSITLFGAALLLSVLPFMILVSTLASERIDDDLSRHLGLNSQGASIVRHLFTSPHAHSTAAIVSALVLAAVGTMAVASSLQSTYERLYDQPHRGWRDVLRFLTWIGVLLGALVAEGALSSRVHRIGGPVLEAVAAFVGVTAFFWWTIHFLLAGRVPWRFLIRPAVVTGVFWVALALFSSFYFSSAVISDSRLYGTIGVVFTLLTWFIAIGAVVILGAATGVVWQQRKGGARPGTAEHAERPRGAGPH